ncbi:MAG TPA: hypothetical protein ENG83_01865 [Nitrospirae bacterium]|nr:hypothetical protein [Nitrospirota bacterium]HDZ03176.1 hypothetical protein [Nitrospirota bacterium]
MYEKFYGLRDRPFNLTSDTGYLYLGSYHKEALDFLSSGIRKNYNLIVLTGDIGSGKTVVLRSFVKGVGPAFEVIQVFYPADSCVQLLQMILLSLGVKSIQGDLNALREELKGRLKKLHSAKKRPLLVVDEAQNLDGDTIEETFRLSELKYKGKRLLNVILTGLPKLQSKLSSLHHIKLQTDAIYHLKSLPKEEVPEYIQYRLSTAGLSDPVVFPGEVIKVIGLFSGGTPRLINTVCDALLVQGYLANEKIITPSILKEALDHLPYDAVPGHPEAEPATAALISKAGHGKNIVSGKQAKRVNSKKAVVVSKQDENALAQDEGHKPDKQLSLRVLVLEKNKRMKVHLDNQFQKYGYNFFITNNLEELFKTLERSNGPELEIIVADAVSFFPGVGREDPAGKRALDSIQAAYACSPIIMTSTLPLTAIRAKLLRRGIPFLLQKPDLGLLDLSEVTTRFDSFFGELRNCLSNIYSQFNAFYNRIIKLTYENTDTIK